MTDKIVWIKKDGSVHKITNKERRDLCRKNPGKYYTFLLRFGGRIMVYDMRCIASYFEQQPSVVKISSVMEALILLRNE